MKLSDSRGVKTALWYTNELLRQEDINSLGEMQYQTIVDKYNALLANKAEGASYVIGGLEVHWSTALTLVLKAGIGLSKTGAYLEGDAWGFSADSEKAFVVAVPEDALVGLNAGGSQDRIDTIQIRPVVSDYHSKSRNFKDPITGLVTSALVPTRREYGYEFMVLAGTEAVNPVAPATTPGWMKVAEVYVSAGYTAVAEASIVSYLDSDEWSTEANSTKGIAEEKEPTEYRGEARYDGLGFFNPGGHQYTAKYDDTHVVVVRDTGELFMLEFDGTDWVAVGNARLENRNAGETFYYVLECTSTEIIVITRPTFYIYRVTWNGTYFNIVQDITNISPVPTFPKFCEFSATEFVLADDNADTVTMYQRVDGVSPFAPVGTPLTITGLSNCALCRLDSTHIVVYDAGALSLSVYYWNGSTFSLVGTPYTGLPSAISSRIYAINSTTVVWGISATSNNTRVFTWNGSVFTLAQTLQVGTGGNVLLAGLGVNQVAISHLSSAYDFGAYEWNGSALTLVGNVLYIGGTAVPEIEHLYNHLFAYMDIGSDALRTLEYYNKTIRQIGTTLGVLDSAALPMARIDGHHIATTNRTTDTLDVYRWDGIGWEKKTTLSLGTVTASKLVCMNANDILVVNNGLAQVYRWDRVANTLTAVGNSLGCQTPTGMSKAKGTQNVAFLFSNTGGGVFRFEWDGVSILSVNDEVASVSTLRNGLVLDDRINVVLMGTSPFTKFFVRENHDEGYYKLRREDDSINTRAETPVLTMLDDDILMVAWNRSAYIHAFKMS